MPILHPVFTLVILILIGYSFLEVYSGEIKNYKSVWIAVVFLIILAGFRKDVGADYPIYKGMYAYFPLHTDFGEIFRKAFFLKNSLELEWFYILLNNLFFFTGLPFFIFTFFIAIVAILPKFHTIQMSAAYPATALMLYIIPGYFIGDSGQMRQGLGMAVAIFSFKYIRERNLPMFLFFMFFALGFHKSTAIFLPAYWLAIIPMNRLKIIGIVVISLILSPLHIYENLSFLSGIAPEEIYQGYTGYVDIASVEGGGIKFLDLISLLNIFFIIAFDKETCAKIPYYEYIRNLGLFGVCLYFVMRGSPIFSSRLPGTYLFFAVLIQANVLAAMSNINYKKFLHFVLVVFVIFYYFVFAKYQGGAGRFLPSNYQNYLWN